MSKIKMRCDGVYKLIRTAEVAAVERGFTVEVSTLSLCEFVKSFLDGTKSRLQVATQAGNEIVIFTTPIPRNRIFAEVALLKFGDELHDCDGLTYEKIIRINPSSIIHEFVLGIMVDKE